MSTGDFEDKEKQINVGIISSQFCQYLRKALDFPPALHHDDKGVDTDQQQVCGPTDSKIVAAQGI